MFPLDQASASNRIPNCTAVSATAQARLSRYSPRSFVIVATRSWAYTLRVANLRRQMPRNFRSSSMNSRFADDDATSATSFGDTKPPGRSSVLPLAKVAFEAHAPGVICHRQCREIIPGQTPLMKRGVSACLPRVRGCDCNCADIDFGSHCCGHNQLLAILLAFRL